MASSANVAVLPTLDKLGVANGDLSSVDAGAVVRAWFKTFSAAVEAKSVADVVAHFASISAAWRDLLGLSWDFRTLHGLDHIREFLEQKLASSGFSGLKLVDQGIALQRASAELVWAEAYFSFEANTGLGSGVLRLIPTRPEGGNGSTDWKAFILFTNLESLNGFPEKTGFLREQRPLHGGWEEKREREREFVGEGAAPTVIVVGGGQAGLQVAARLKVLNVPTLVVEKQGRVGDQWRNRYEALCLHDPVWYDHMPYLPFPPTWPVYTPARKLADWLESYAHSLELNVWTSSTVTKVEQDPNTEKWTVSIERESGEKRTFVVNHVVFALGFGGGMPYIPKFDGMDEFKSKILHSINYTSARDYIGKKVVVLGACTSAHDICSDFAKNGVDVTMYQRNPTYVMSSDDGLRLALPMFREDGPPVEQADRITASFPWFHGLKMSVQRTAEIKRLDKPMLDKLQRTGFQTWDGPDDSGFVGLLWKRGGGYYFDTGACDLIIRGLIKVKNGTSISRFTASGLEFTDGTTLPADVVVCATGFGDAKEPLRRMCGDSVVERMKPLWGLDKEGEVPGLWRKSGVPGIWVQMGNLAMGRFYSKHLALQIKAIEEGVAPRN